MRAMESVSCVRELAICLINLEDCICFFEVIVILLLGYLVREGKLTYTIDPGAPKRNRTTTMVSRNNAIPVLFVHKRSWQER
jgi:hypothetical protein